MSYIESNLMNGESVKYKAKLHWIIFIWPTIWIFLSFIMFSSGGDSYYVGIIFILIAIITGIFSFINYSSSEFGITNKRVLAKIGLIRRNSIEVLLIKVEGIQVYQGILGRILGFGSIIISGTGGTKDPFHKIADPLQFRRMAQELISSVQDSK